MDKNRHYHKYIQRRFKSAKQSFLIHFVSTKAQCTQVLTKPSSLLTLSRNLDLVHYN